MTDLSEEFAKLQSALAGEYSLERELGRGGMGIVYRARDVQLDRPVAIKLLPPKFTMNITLRERFLREARTVASLSHPHIVPIHRVAADVAGSRVAPLARFGRRELPTHQPRVDTERFACRR